MQKEDYRYLFKNLRNELKDVQRDVIYLVDNMQRRLQSMENQIHFLETRLAPANGNTSAILNPNQSILTKNIQTGDNRKVVVKETTKSTDNEDTITVQPMQQKEVSYQDQTTVNQEQFHFTPIEPSNTPFPKINDKHPSGRTYRSILTGVVVNDKLFQDLIDLLDEMIDKGKRSRYTAKEKYNLERYAFLFEHPKQWKEKMIKEKEEVDMMSKLMQQ
ncbi:MAG: hypothetical protein OEY49_15385 [Candidatus Heimdallarchaeota archaeon]|nr:hypothetical protein [Candidatus Heimdallarchaeota archaeon]